MLITFPYFCNIYLRLIRGTKCLCHHWQLFLLLTAPGGEIDSLNQANVEACVKCIEANRDMIVGVKVRLSETIANDGRNEEEAYR